MRSLFKNSKLSAGVLLAAVCACGDAQIELRPGEKLTGLLENSETLTEVAGARKGDVEQVETLSGEFERARPSVQRLKENLSEEDRWLHFFESCEREGASCFDSPLPAPQVKMDHERYIFLKSPFISDRELQALLDQMREEVLKNREIVVRSELFLVSEGASVWTKGLGLQVFAEKILIRGGIQTTPAQAEMGDYGRAAGGIRLVAPIIEFGKNAVLDARGGAAGVQRPHEPRRILPSELEEMRRELRAQFVRQSPPEYFQESVSRDHPALLGIEHRVQDVLDLMGVERGSSGAKTLTDYLFTDIWEGLESLRDLNPQLCRHQLNNNYEWVGRISRTEVTELVTSPKLDWEIPLDLTRQEIPGGDGGRVELVSPQAIRGAPVINTDPGQAQLSSSGPRYFVPSSEAYVPLTKHRDWSVNLQYYHCEMRLRTRQLGGRTGRDEAGVSGTEEVWSFVRFYSVGEIQEGFRQKEVQKFPVELRVASEAAMGAPDRRLGKALSGQATRLESPQNYMLWLHSAFEDEEITQDFMELEGIFGPIDTLRKHDTNLYSRGRR